MGLNCRRVFRLGSFAFAGGCARATWTSLFIRSRSRSATNSTCCRLMRADMASARRGVGQDLFSLRDYQPQDDLRHIDWKATARSRNLTVREFTAEDERRITIVLDTRDLSESDEENFCRGLRRV